MRPGYLWLFLGVSGRFLAISGCFWVFPGYFWVFLGGSWLFLYASGYFLAISGFFWLLQGSVAQILQRHFRSKLGQNVSVKRFWDPNPEKIL